MLPNLLLLAAICLLAPATAYAECTEWKASVTLALRAPGTVNFTSNGAIAGLSIKYSAYNPTSRNVGLESSVVDLGSLIEIRDSRGTKVDLGPSHTWPARTGSAHPPRWKLSVPAGERAVLHVNPSWLRIPRGGVFTLRAGYSFRDMSRAGKKPRCEVWSDWVTVEVRPLVSIPDTLAATGTLVRHLDPGVGVLVPSPATGEVFWIHRDKTSGEAKRTVLGRTSEDPRATGGFEYRSLDALVSRSGEAHVVFEVLKSKTRYVRIGLDGALRKAVTLDGAKRLVRAGTDDEDIALKDGPVSSH